MDIKASIEKIWPYLHSIPEPAFQEHKTSAYLAEVLSQSGYTVTEHVGSDTGLVGVLCSGKPGPVVALRSDMDSLQFRRDDGSSVCIHACGHDAHMAMVLTTALVLAEEGLPCGTLKILFQPAEEIGKGALTLLDAGALDDVDYVVGLHVMPKNLARKGQIIAQLNWTACTLIEAVVHGKAAHGSQPHLGINAIDAGAAIVQAINALPVDPLLGGSVKTTRFLGGADSLNAICDEVKLGFDLRSTSNAEMLHLRERVRDIITQTAAVYGATADSHIVGTCPAAEADPSLRKVTEESIRSVLGDAGLIPSVSVTIGEDFNFFKQERPALKTASLGIGCDLEPTLHDPKMHFDLEALPDVVRVLATLLRRILTERP
ncbi:MAG: amidohydrolase [Succiniclasticum sp.]|jgi:amidohydrolase